METQEAETIIKTGVFLGKKCLGVGVGVGDFQFKLSGLLRLSM